jgi:hypothetical protein
MRISFNSTGKFECVAIASPVREQRRTLEREHSIDAFRKQVNLVERTWNDHLRAMSELNEVTHRTLQTANFPPLPTLAFMSVTDHSTRLHKSTPPFGRTPGGVDHEPVQPESLPPIQRRPVRRSPS